MTDSELTLQFEAQKVSEIINYLCSSRGNTTESGFLMIDSRCGGTP